MSAPADRPAASRPTEAELAAIEARHRLRAMPWSEWSGHWVPEEERDLGKVEHVPYCDACACRDGDPDIHALIAEIRRLRAALAPLVAEAPTRDTEVGHVYCAYCRRRLTPDVFQFPDRRPYPPGHESNCPWLVAQAALGLAPPAPQT